MKILVLADTHGEIGFIDMIYPTLKNADMVIIAGDITHFGGKYEAERLIDSIRIVQPNVYAIQGNCDRKSVGEYLTAKGINLHGRVTEIDGYSFVGIGYSGPTPSRTPGERSKTDFDKMVSEIEAIIPENKQTILVSHVPPAETRCDQLYSGGHIGSDSVRRIIEKKQPLMCLCGHIHESDAVDKIGDTIIVNPGDVGDGRYAWIDLSVRPVRATLKNHNLGTGHMFFA